MKNENLELSPREVLLTRLVRDTMASTGEFKPVAFYHDELDCIQVITVDCSVTEVRITDLLVLLERNHLDVGQLKYVGFHVQGARWFCRENGLPYHGTVKVSDIIKRICELDKVAMPAILDVALPMLEDNKIDELVFP